MADGAAPSSTARQTNLFISTATPASTCEAALVDYSGLCRECRQALGLAVNIIERGRGGPSGDVAGFIGRDGSKPMMRITVGA
jgi:hypothetical protein